MGHELVSFRAWAHLQTLLNMRRADQSQSVISEALLGWGKGCNRFWARSDVKSGFHGNHFLVS